MTTITRDERPVSYYQVGTVNIIKGSMTVTGHETYWLSNLPCNYSMSKPLAGNVFTLDNANFYIIKSIVSDTELEIDRPFEEPDTDIVSYAVITNTFVDATEVGVDIAKLNAELAAGIKFISDTRDEINTTADEVKVKADETEQNTIASATSSSEAQLAKKQAEKAKADSEALKLANENLKVDVQNLHNQTEDLKNKASDWNDKAKKWAVNPRHVIVDNGEYSAKSYAEDSSDSSVASKASEVRSQEWASNPVNKVVDNNEFSSKHYESRAKAALASANLAAKRSEDARDIANASAVQTANALVLRGDWQPATGLPTPPKTNSIWYVSSTETDPSNPSIHWQQGDYLVFKLSNSNWSRLTGEPVAAHTPGPLHISDDLILKPEKAIRFETVDGDPDPVYAVGMHRNAQKENRLLYGDWTVGDLKQIVFAIPDANNILVSEHLDKNNDWEPTPSATYQILSTKNGVPKTGGTFTGLIKCAILPATNDDLINKKYFDDEFTSFKNVVNVKVASTKAIADSKWLAVDATPTVKGIVKLTNKVNSTQPNTAASATALKQAFDLASSKMTQTEGDARYFWSGHKPTKTDVGLSHVLNYTKTDDPKDSSANKYATAKAVNEAYKKAESATQSIANTVSKTDADARYFWSGHKPTKSDVGLGNVLNYAKTDDPKDASANKYATGKAVNEAYKKALTAAAGVNKKWTPVDATVAKKGIVQLSSRFNLNNETMAATPKAVKSAMDKAISATSIANTKISQDDADDRYAQLNGTSVQIPTGNDANKPAGKAGLLRYNSINKKFEGFTTKWGSIGGGIPSYPIIKSDHTMAKNTGALFDVSTKDIFVKLPKRSDIDVGQWVSVGIYGKANGNKINLTCDDIPVMGLKGADLPFIIDGDWSVFTFSYVDNVKGYIAVNAIGESEAPNAIKTAIRNTFPKGTDTFKLQYDIGYVDVFVGGYKLPHTAYQAGTGTKVVLNDPLLKESYVEVIAWNHVTIGEVTTDMVTDNNGKSVQSLISSLKSELSQAKQKIESLHPVGSVVMRMDAINPGTIYDGTWALITGDASLSFGDGKARNGAISGNNNPVVPLPLHNHKATQASHSHQYSRMDNFYVSAGNGAVWPSSNPVPTSGWSRYARIAGHSGSGIQMRMHNAHTNTASSSKPIKISNTGTSTAKLDVRGARISINVWQRTA